MQDRREKGTGFRKGYGPNSTVQCSHLAARACGTRRTVEMAQGKGVERKHNSSETVWLKWCITVYLNFVSITL